LPYAQIAVAIGVAAVLACAADLLTGRRGLFATGLVSGVGAVLGWFLAVRVFGVATTHQWPWLIWSAAASVLALGAYFLFRSKR
jgi:hypothetical protein